MRKLYFYFLKIIITLYPLFIILFIYMPFFKKKKNSFYLTMINILYTMTNKLFIIINEFYVVINNLYTMINKLFIKNNIFINSFKSRYEVK